MLRTVIVLIDNYDSFLHNLARYFVRLGQDVRVLRNDSPEIDAAMGGNCQGIVLSPGPCGPGSAGRCLEIVSRWSGKLPILGVCLGHQVIYEAFGGTVARAAAPVHGRSTSIRLGESRLFESIPAVESFARYHSLVGLESSLPSCLRVTARSLDSEEIMAVEHVQDPTFGVQFHPESVLSSSGYQMLSNFLQLAGLDVPSKLPANDWIECKDSTRAQAATPDGETSHAVFLPQLRSKTARSVTARSSDA